MPTLEDYFSDRKLARILCRKRVAATRTSRRDQFIDSIAGAKRRHGPRDLLNALLPPRRAWPGIRPRRAERATLGDAPTKLASSMFEHVMVELRRSKPRYRWVSRLRAFLDSVRCRALGWTNGTEFRCEKIYAFAKANPGNGQKYRIVAAYSLEDSLICGGFAAYLRDLIDGVLSPAVLSFRPAASPDSPPPSHHDAIAMLRELDASVPIDADLWCAEADIEGFFDAVSHDVAYSETARLLTWAEREPDTRLLGFLRSFLSGYDFPGVAVPAAQELLRMKGITSPRLADPVKTLVSRGIRADGAADRIGIPQGSALSCVLANIVLSAADSVVEAKLRATGCRGAGLYLRYCDDIIIVHRDRSIAELLCREYLDMAVRLRLPVHPVATYTVYPGRRTPRPDEDEAWFWGGKSKAPYRWSPPTTGSGVPWLAFVGYQLARGGAVRVRDSSIRKELKKQRAVASDTIRRVRILVRKHRKQGQSHAVPPVWVVRYRSMMHLLSIGVGYPSPWSTSPAVGAVSWCRGFRGAPTGSSVLEPFRRLDRGRTLVLRYLAAQLRSMLRMGRLTVRLQKAGRKGFRLKFDGPPLSYAHQFVLPPPLPPISPVPAAVPAAPAAPVAPSE